MALDHTTLETHRNYLNHVLACRVCYAPTKRYCLDGYRLYVMYQGWYMMSQPIETRRAVLRAIEASDAGHCDDLKACMLDIHKATREAEADVLDDGDTV